MMRLRSVVGGRGWKSGIFSFCRFGEGVVEGGFAWFVVMGRADRESCAGVGMMKVRFKD